MRNVRWVAALRMVLIGVATIAVVASATAADAPRFSLLGAEPKSTPIVRVYVVRHAQAWKNMPSAKRPPGMGAEQLDSLTEQGQAQAKQVGARLADAGVTRVVTSPAQRARQTAEGIAGVLGTGPVDVSRAFEPLQHGASRDAANYRWRTDHWKRGEDPRPPDGESLGDGLARAASFVDAIGRDAPGTTLVVVTHGEITAALLSHAAGISPHAGYARYFVGEGTISDIAVTADGWQLLATGVRP
jgi:probable phosphoglycerate mutase